VNLDDRSSLLTNPTHSSFSSLCSQYIKRNLPSTICRRFGDGIKGISSLYASNLSSGWLVVRSRMGLLSVSSLLSSFSIENIVPSINRYNRCYSSSAEGGVQIPSYGDPYTGYCSPSSCECMCEMRMQKLRRGGLVVWKIHLCSKMR